MIRHLLGMDQRLDRLEDHLNGRQDHQRNTDGDAGIWNGHGDLQARRDVGGAGGAQAQRILEQQHHKANPGDGGNDGENVLHALAEKIDENIDLHMAVAADSDGGSQHDIQDKQVARPLLAPRLGVGEHIAQNDLIDHDNDHDKDGDGQDDLFHPFQQVKEF